MVAAPADSVARGGEGQGDGAMQARITRYKMKPDAIEAAQALMNSLRDDITGLPGMRHFVGVMNPDGSGYTIALIDSEGTSPESVDRVRAIWGRFSDHLEGMPVPEIFDVVADWPAN